MTTDNDLMMQSLELAAERCEDLTPLVYDEFFALAPDARAFFSMDELSRGRMLQEVISLLLDQADERGYVTTVADTLGSDHRSYGDITGTHYRLFFDALRATLCKLLAESWSGDFDAAWRRQGDRLGRAFEQAPGVRNAPGAP